MYKLPCHTHKIARRHKTKEAPHLCIMCGWYKNPTNVDIFVGNV